ncbi:TetR/AcrR family transcriptional regulator [Burkholderia cenocepacia]|uniref:TetR/AcrR family transcriptional regulator n=1 Tax=Burkholderia cenocepacia TaxID=95486 RepID=UPI00406BFFB2
MRTIAARRPRRTNIEVDSAIAAATLAELREKGYAGVTYDAVARRAGTSKPVLYRRYATRASMVLTALTRLPRAAPPPNTGSLRGDLIAWIEGARTAAVAVGTQNYRALVGELDDGLLNQFREVLAGAESNINESIIKRAKERGELGEHPIPSHVAILPFTMLRQAALFGGAESVDVSAVVDDICLPLLKQHSYQLAKP